MSQDAVGEVCVVNIGPRERQRRLLVGVVGVLVGVVLLAVMVALGVERGWRLALFIPFVVGTSGYFQAVDRT